jgi:integrase
VDSASLGSYRVTEVKAVAVEQWLRSLKYANGSKAKARNIMSAVFNHAVRWEWLDLNPIRMVRQSAKRTRMPIVLSIEQIAALLRILKEPTRTMVFLAVFTGLRVGELLGLKWKDIDFQKMEIHVIRSIVMQHVGDCKTEASRKPVPLDLRLSKVLWNWRMHSPYPIDEDWVFASPHSKGKLPYWPGSLYKAHLEPAAKEIGIMGHFGWHTFRHTYATLLKGGRRGREGCPRANAARKHLGHSERLCASNHANEARRAEPSCEFAARQKRRKTKHRGLSDCNGPTKFWRGFASG